MIHERCGLEHELSINVTTEDMCVVALKAMLAAVMAKHSGHWKVIKTECTCSTCVEASKCLGL